MKKFRVGVPQVHVVYFEVQAEDMKEARDKAEDAWADAHFKGEGPEYSETFGIAQWLIEEAEA